MFRFFTAGESHGEALVANISGLPTGIPVSEASIDRELWRRQQGFGRGGRMRIEHDHARILSGVRHGHSIGSPIAMLIENRDWQNWNEALPVGEGDPAKHKAVKSPRPGHADLAGALKYNLPEARYVLERASARETAARVAAGAVAKQVLATLDIEVLSHVIQVGEARLSRAVSFEELRRLAASNEVLLNCADEKSEQYMKAEVDAVLRNGDTVGGIFEVVAHNVPPGLGTYANWDERLDAKFAAAVMSIQAVKAVEIGDGILIATSHGSKAQDEIGYARGDEPAGVLHSKFTRFTRAGNYAGGIEGGISNGCDIVLRGHLKPISTLRRPLGSVDFASREVVKAAYERSDVCAVEAAGVVGEAMVALVLAAAALEKFGGDSLVELRRNYEDIASSFATTESKEAMIYPIVKYGDPVLETPASAVTEFDDKLKKLVEDMFESMYEAQGVGLAAPQIGISLHLSVIDTSFKEDPEARLVLANPQIVHVEGKQAGGEGCLSIPDFRENLTRGKRVTIRAQDVHGNWYEKTGEDLLARAFQHEIDHLNGTLFIHHLSSLKRDMMRRKIRRLQRQGEW